MTPEQIKLAASELRARANLHIGEPVGERCRLLAAALENLAGERRPYAWEITQGEKRSLVPAQEFSRNTYDRGAFKPLFE